MSKFQDQIYNEAFIDELQKIAGVKTEFIGAGSGPASAIGALVAAVTPTKTKEQMKKQQKKTWSNLIPGIGAYRHFKRLGYSQKSLNKEIGKK